MFALKPLAAIESVRESRGMSVPSFRQELLQPGLALRVDRLDVLLQLLELLILLAGDALEAVAAAKLSSAAIEAVAVPLDDELASGTKTARSVHVLALLE